jgi:TetR/AcrR family transcriptional repressor of mexJK operon
MTVEAASTRSERKREAIMSAGRDLFLAQGYRGTSVDEIAARAGVSKQTVYKQFGDKRELLGAIVNAVLDGGVPPILERIAALADSTEVEQDLVTLAADYLRSVLAEPVVQLRRLVVGQANALPDLAASYYQRAPVATLRAFTATFETWDQRGVLRIPDAESAAALFASLVVGPWIDRALFFGGPTTLATLDVERQAGDAVRAFMAVYRRP